MGREDILRDLLTLNGDLNTIRTALSEYPFDSDHEYVTVQNQNLIDILNKFLANEIDSSQLEEWANIIECRDDIGFEKEHFSEIIFTLANPALNYEITEQSVKELLLTLS